MKNFNSLLLIRSITKFIGMDLNRPSNMVDFANVFSKKLGLKYLQIPSNIESLETFLRETSLQLERLPQYRREEFLSVILGIIAASKRSSVATISATGGTITTSGGYVYHSIFTSNDTLVFTGIGYLSGGIVIGGGAGSSTGGGGGGAGRLVDLNTTFLISNDTLAVTRGLKGIGTTYNLTGANPSNNGGDTYLGTRVTAKGGGCGKSIEGPNGANGGSGGGGPGNSSTSRNGGTAQSILEPTGSIGYGNNGGTNNGLLPGPYASGGGGGAGGTGQNAPSNSVAGNGGIGKSYPDGSGGTKTYCIGGKGSVYGDGSTHNGNAGINPGDGGEGASALLNNGLGGNGVDGGVLLWYLA